MYFGFITDRNEPSRFFGDGAVFKAKLIGILEVGEARGDRMCQEALQVRLFVFLMFTQLIDIPYLDCVGFKNCDSSCWRAQTKNHDSRDH